jgi:hypothetical protein
LRRQKMLLLIHTGIVLILAGGILGSERAHAFFNRRSTTPRLVRALMPLREGQTSKPFFRRAVTRSNCRLRFAWQRRRWSITRRPQCPKIISVIWKSSKTALSSKRPTSRSTRPFITRAITFIRILSPLRTLCPSAGFWLCLHEGSARCLPVTPLPPRPVRTFSAGCLQEKGLTGGP